MSGIDAVVIKGKREFYCLTINNEIDDHEQKTDKRFSRECWRPYFFYCHDLDFQVYGLTFSAGELCVPLLPFPDKEPQPLYLSSGHTLRL